MSKKTSVTILILVVVILGGYFLFKSGNVQAPAGESPTTDTNDSTTSAARVTYSDLGYSPSNINIKLGGTVTWVNNSSQNMWTASGVHPSHVTYSGTSVSAHCPDTAGVAFDACKGITPGSSWSFTFNKKGSWSYHNHLNANHFGTVVVE